MPKVSVIVPVYNVEKYLSKCLDSLVNQTLEDIEIIVVNDGTKDNSQTIIDEYAKKYNNIKSYIKENGGLSSARNYGIKRASGEYIGFVDSDDYVDYDMYLKLYNKAKEEDLDIVVCSDYEVFESGVKKEITLPNYSKNNVKSYIISPPMAPTRLIKRSLLENDSFTPKIFYEDLNFTPTLVLKTKKIGFLNEPLYYYLQRNDSIMHQKESNPKMDDIFIVLSNLKEKLYSFYEDEIEYLYITHLLRSATLRYICYKNTKDKQNKIINIMKEEFPDWKQNKYYKNSSIKNKIICNLAINKQTFLLKLILKISR